MEGAGTAPHSGALERLSGLDAWLLGVEDDVTQLHVGSTAVFAGPAPSFPDVRAMIAGKLPLVPRYRQRVRKVPGGVSRPVWAPDPHFNLDYHLRHTGLPPPGSREQLRNLIGRVMANKLDRTKPLWEMWVVEGLLEGRWALIAKAHYALVDGVTGTDLLAVLLDDGPEPSPAVPDTWRPPGEPSDLRLLGEALTDCVASPHEHLRAARAVRRVPRAVAGRAGALVRGLASRTTRPGLTPGSSLIGPIGPHRRYAWAQASLDDVALVRRSAAGPDGLIPGLTVNDVVLAAVTRGFRALLAARGDAPEHRIVRTLVPMSVYPEEGGGAYANRVVVVTAELPVGFADPLRRVAAVHEEMATLVGTRQTVAAGTLTALSGFSSPLLLAIGARVATRAVRRGGVSGAHAVTTNAPGPAEELYALGRPMEEVYPYTSIVGPARVGVAVFSYRRHLTFGLTADWDAVPELDILAAGIQDSIPELAAAVKAST